MPARRISATASASTPPVSSAVTDSALTSISARAVAQQRERLGQGRHALAGPLAAEALGVAGRDGAHLGERQLADVATAGRGALEVGVVDHDHAPVARELDVQLDGAGAELERPRKRGERVLGAVGRVAPVGDHERRPGQGG
jgi:hypothetical protein